MDQGKKATGAAIKAHIARLGISREEFSHRHGIPMGTLEKMVTGLFTEKSIERMEQKTGIPFRKTAQGGLGRASDDLGGYLHADYRSYEGFYTLIRSTFDSPDRICLFPVKIDWDEARPGLRINGQTEAGYQKFAHLAFPRGCSYLFIHGNEKGWNSLMIIGTIDVEDAMPGALMTMGNIGGGLYSPFFLPILLRKDGNQSRKYREIDHSDPSFAAIKKKLDAVVFDKFLRGLAFS